MPNDVQAVKAFVFTILDRIETRRRLVDITKREMMKRADVSESALRNMKRGIPPNIRTLFMIARALDVPLAHFIAPENTPGKIDVEVLERALKVVEDEMTRLSRVTTRKRKTIAIAAIYEGLMIGKKFGTDDLEERTHSK